jgi:hypothetical protein
MGAAFSIGPSSVVRAGDGNSRLGGGWVKDTVKVRGLTGGEKCGAVRQGRGRWIGGT